SADALNVLRGAGRRQVLPETRDEAVKIAAQFRTQVPWFERWRNLFLTPPRTNATAGQVDDLQAADPIIGWTAANVLRRCTLDETRLSDIRRVAAAHETNAVRWRAVHVLGAFPSRENL